MNRNIVRGIRCLIALTLVVGGVWLLRFTAQDLLRGTSPLPEIPVGRAISEPFPRVYHLMELVPAALRTTFGGMSAERDSEHLTMPPDLAREVVAARCAAQGWKALDELPADIGLTLRSMGLQCYVTPERGYVQIEVRPEGEGSRVKTFHFSPDGADPLCLDPDVPLPNPRTLLRQAAAKNRAERLLPLRLRDLCLGHASYTQLTERNGGAAFYLTMSAAGITPESAARILAEKATAFGWRQDTLRAETLRLMGEGAVYGMPANAKPACSAAYVFDNLACTVRFFRGESFGETVLCYRFTDDEVLARLPRKEEL